MPGVIVCPPARVEPSWIDYNGHMNIGYYSIAFDKALDYVFDRLGIGVDYVQQSSGSVFAAEAHLTYAQELPRDAPIEITFQLLDWDAKRLHFFQRMLHATARYVAATQEQLSLHVNMTTRRSAPFPGEIQERLAALAREHAELPRPAEVGRTIGIRRNK